MSVRKFMSLILFLVSVAMVIASLLYFFQEHNTTLAIGCILLGMLTHYAHKTVAATPH